MSVKKVSLVACFHPTPRFLNSVESVLLDDLVISQLNNISNKRRGGRQTKNLDLPVCVSDTNSFE